MKARTRTAVTTLALLAAAAGALLWAWYGVEQRGAEEARQKEAEATVLSFEPARVTSLTVEAKGDTTRLDRTAGAKGAAWRVEGLGEEADAGAVDALLTRLAGLRRKAVAAEHPDAAALSASGLAPPRGRIQLALEGGGQLSLAIGDASGFDGSLAVRAGEGPVVLVAADAEWSLLKKTDDLRDRALLHLEPDAIKGVRLLAGGKLAWEVRRGAAEGATSAAGAGARRAGESAWALVAPRAAPADAAKVDGLLRTLSFLRALRFAGGAARAREAGLDSPARTLVLLGEKGAELGRVELGREANDSVFARSSGSPRILELDKASLAALPASAAELEEKSAPAPAPEAPPAAPVPAAKPQGN